MDAERSIERLRAARQEAVRRYLARPTPAGYATPHESARASVLPDREDSNIVGVGLGDKMIGDHMHGEVAIKLYVRRKKLLTDLSRADRLPASIDGIPTDVEEVGVIRTLDDCTQRRRQYVRPVPGGYSIGHADVTAGTLGALVRDSGRIDNGRRYVLSNNHVLADANRAAIGDVIVQPGPMDGGGLPEHVIGYLSRLVRLDVAGGLNSVDAAIAEVQPGSVLASVCSIGTPRSTIQPRRGLFVVKHGRTTGLTQGLITDTEADFNVEVGGQTAFFTDTIVIRGVSPTIPFSEPGDSGALVLDGDRRACGLLFAGASAADLTLANPIRRVFRRLRIRLAPAD